MARYILNVLIIAVSLMALPTIALAESNTNIGVMSNAFQDISISMTGSALHVMGANGEVLNIYNLAGVCVMSIKVDGADKRYDLSLQKGCYIVKIGKVTRKIAIQ